jgi:hypothetical protein
MSKIGRGQNGNRFGNGFQLPDEIQDILSKAERSICLPYELSIIDIDRILSAIGATGATSDIVLNQSKGEDKRTVNSPTAFDIWEFVFDSVYELPTAICTLVHEPTSSTVCWDEDERFVVIAGSKMFCDNAFPHSYEVLEHFYVQSTINEFEDEKMLRECFAKLTSCR